jgi:hypothetical protein
MNHKPRFDESNLAGFCLSDLLGETMADPSIHLCVGKDVVVHRQGVFPADAKSRLVRPGKEHAIFDIPEERRGCSYLLPIVSVGSYALVRHVFGHYFRGLELDGLVFLGLVLDWEELVPSVGVGHRLGLLRLEVLEAAAETRALVSPGR